MLFHSLAPCVPDLPFLNIVDAVVVVVARIYPPGTFLLGIRLTSSLCLGRTTSTFHEGPTKKKKVQLYSTIQRKLGSRPSREVSKALLISTIAFK